MNASLVRVYWNGEAMSLTCAATQSSSAFGGPAEFEFHGAPLDHPLHLVANLNHNEVAAIRPPRYIFDLPLLYGMRYSGCTLTYSFQSSAITVESIDPPASSDDWPYRHYPAILPYHPLSVLSTEQQSWSEFAYGTSNLSEDQPAECVVLVPPPFGLGFTMWGRGGDAEEVTLVFECDLLARRVKAYNVCS